MQAHYGKALYDAGDRKKGRKKMEKAVELYEQNPMIKEYSGTRSYLHLNYAAVLSAYGTLLLQEGQEEKSKEKLEKALEIQKEMLNGDNAQRAMTLSNLGMVEHKLWNQGDNNMQLALSMMERISSEHYINSQIGMNYAQVLLDNGNYQQAKSHIEKAVRALEISCGSNVHPKIGECYELLSKQSSSTELPVYLDKACSVYQTLIERERKLCSDSTLDLMNVGYVVEWRRKVEEMKNRIGL